MIFNVFCPIFLYFNNNNNTVALALCYEVNAQRTQRDTHTNNTRINLFVGGGSTGPNKKRANKVILMFQF